MVNVRSTYFVDRVGREPCSWSRQLVASLLFKPCRPQVLTIIGMVLMFLALTATSSTHEKVQDVKTSDLPPGCDSLSLFRFLRNCVVRPIGYALARDCLYCVRGKGLMI